jgi:hypothetical protein
MILPHGDRVALIVRATANIVAAGLIAPFQLCAYAALHRRLEETALGGPWASGGAGGAVRASSSAAGPSLTCFVAARST